MGFGHLNPTVFTEIDFIASMTTDIPLHEREEPATNTSQNEDTQPG